jgi:hypothetical protein
MQESLIFVIGPPRSGSTMLQRMLASHSAIYTHPEPHIITPLAHLGYFENVEKAPYDHINAVEAIREYVDVLPNGEEDYRECYVLIGDRNWQRTPQYISMLVLLIRICLMWEVPEWIDDAYALTGYWHEFIYNTEDRPDNSDITVFLTNSYHHMLLMVAHDREIFPGNMLSAYSSRHNSFHGSSGINALVCDDSVHPKAAEKLKHYYNTEVLLNDRSG